MCMHKVLYFFHHKSQDNPYYYIWLLYCVHVLCCAESLSHVQLFAMPWTVAHQAPLPTGILQARILEWVAMPSSRGSSQLMDRTQVSHTAGGFFTEPPGKPKNTAVGSISLLQGYCVCVYAKMSLYTLYNNPLISDSSIPGRQEIKLPITENQSRRLCHLSHVPWRVKHPRVNWH